MSFLLFNLETKSYLNTLMVTFIVNIWLWNQPHTAV